MFTLCFSRGLSDFALSDILPQVLAAPSLLILMIVLSFLITTFWMWALNPFIFLLLPNLEFVCSLEV